MSHKFTKNNFDTQTLSFSQHLDPVTKKQVFTRQRNYDFDVKTFNLASIQIHQQKVSKQNRDYPIKSQIKNLLNPNPQVVSLQSIERAHTPSFYDSQQEDFQQLKINADFKNILYSQYGCNKQLQQIMKRREQSSFQRDMAYKCQGIPVDDYLVQDKRPRSVSFRDSIRQRVDINSTTQSVDLNRSLREQLKFE